MGREGKKGVTTDMNKIQTAKSFVAAKIPFYTTERGSNLSLIFYTRQCGENLVTVSLYVLNHCDGV
jgi:hypothetical protein